MIDKKSKVYIDASFFVALQVINHPYHKQAKAKLSVFKNMGLYFSILTIDEVLHALSRYEKDKNTIKKIIEESILDVKNVEILGLVKKSQSIRKYLRVWLRFGLKPRDALHLYLMKENKINKIASFDSDFINNQKLLKIKAL